jgi:hypothetical protein
MVGNEKYTGDALFQKTYTDDSFNRHANKGEEEQYPIENHHEAIISHEDFEAAQAIIQQHGKEKCVSKHVDKYQNRYPFSGKIICEHCGGTFKRRVHASGKYRGAWCCTTHLSDMAKCPVKYIPDCAFEYAFVTMMNKLIFGHQAVLRPLLAGLRGINSDGSLASIRESTGNSRKTRNSEMCWWGFSLKATWNQLFTIRGTASFCGSRQEYSGRRNRSLDS